MVSMPGEMPVTAPPEVTDAWVLLLPHVPPVTLSVSVMVLPVQTAVAPVIDPESGCGNTVMLCVAVAVPQLLVTE